MSGCRCIEKGGSVITLHSRSLSCSCTYSRRYIYVVVINHVSHVMSQIHFTLVQLKCSSRKDTASTQVSPMIEIIFYRRDAYEQDGEELRLISCSDSRSQICYST